MSLNPEAETYYQIIREEDVRLSGIEGQARNLVRRWTGYESVAHYTRRIRKFAGDGTVGEETANE